MTLTIGIAPDSFKSTLSAEEAAGAMARGARRVYPDAEVLEMPMADGGEGTSALLAGATGGSAVTLPTTDPLGRPMEATVHRLGDDTTWAVDTAAASGLALLARHDRDPGRACSAGTGALIHAAAQRGARTVILGLGGSATVDGGVGLCRALGVRWLDPDGADLPPGGDGLVTLAKIDTRAVPAEIRRLGIRMAHDVNSPLTGPRGAAAIFAPQKGADPAGVRRLAAGLERLAEVLAVDGLAQRPGTGAAGGISASLVALLHASLEPGAPLVFDQAGWADPLQRCDLVLVAEGRLDAQTAAGKAPAYVAARAARLSIPVLAVAGTLGPGAHTVPHIHQLESLYEKAPDPLPSPAQAATQLTTATERLVRRWSSRPRQT
jgi:glycerate 2-kinase